MYSPLTYIVGFALFFFAAFTKGILGFGVNIIAIPIMSLLVGPKEAIAVVSLPGFLNNLIVIWQWRDTNSLPILKRVAPLLITGVIGITLGSILLVNLHVEIIEVVLGVVTLVYVLTDKVRQNWHIPPEKERFWSAPTGFVAGLLGGISGITGPILVAYLHSLQLDKRYFVYAISLIFVLFSGSQSLNLWLLGRYSGESFLFAIFCIIPLIVGTLVGNKAQAKISQVLFNRLLLIALFATGLDLIRRGLF